MTMPPAGPPPGYQGPQGPLQGLQPPPQPATHGTRNSGHGPRAQHGGHPDATMALNRPDFPPPPGHQAPGPQRPGSQTSGSAGTGWVLLLAAVALVFVVLGLSITEDSRNAWDSVHAWGGLAIAGALAVAAPALGHSFGLGARRAWQVAAAGAGALGLFWVLFTLPVVGTNTSLLTTLGVAAAVLAVWIAPGHAGDGDPGRQS